MARTRSAKMGLPRRQWEDEGTRSNNALVTQVDPKRSFPSALGLERRPPRSPFAASPGTGFPFENACAPSTREKR
jgi:hypothetical protein